MINSSFNQISISSSPIPTPTISLPLLNSSKSHPIIKKEMVIEDDDVDDDQDNHHHHHQHQQPYERRRRKSSISSTSSSTIDKKTNNNRKRRGNLPRAVTSILREWLANHKQHPYPTDEEKLALSQQTHLTLNQVSNWFINARRRILITMLEEDKKLNSINDNNHSHPHHHHHANHSSKLIF